MSFKDQVDKILRLIRDAEDRMRIAQAKLDATDKELSTLKTLMAQLTENIQKLKQKGTVPIVGDFRKAKLDLEKTVQKIDQVNWDRTLVARGLSEAQYHQKQLKAVYEKLLEEADQNVLTFTKADK